MPELEYVKKATSALADGAAETVTDTIEEKKHLDTIVIHETAASAITKSTMEIKIDNITLTDPDVPVAMALYNNPLPFKIDRDVSKGQKINVKVTNREGAARTFWVVLVYTA